MGKIDPSYNSFSPSRADKQWDIFFENLPILRKRFAPWERHEKDLKARNEELNELDNYFINIIDDHREKVFNLLQEKTEYLISLYRQNVASSKLDLQDYNDLSGKGGLSVVLAEIENDAARLKADYQKDVSQRARQAEKIQKVYSITSPEDESVILNETQKKLNSDRSVQYFFRGSDFQDKELIENLIELDIDYGSFSETEESEIFDPDEEVILPILVKTYGLKTENEVPTKNEWIRLFQSFTPEKITEAAKMLKENNDYEWDQAGSEWAVKDFLRAIRPIIKDLKSNEDALFFKCYGGNPTPEPPSSLKILQGRAQRHAQQFKEIVQNEKNSRRQ